MSSPFLSFRHLLIALFVVIIWGVNFVAVKFALLEIPPLWLCTLRFVFVSVPAVFFLPRPAVSWKLLLLYGFTIFALQFGFLFTGMKLGMPAGLSALLLQFQVFVTLALATLFLKEKVSAIQLGGAVVAAVGFCVVAVHTGGEVTMAGIVCLLLAATSWGYANFTSKRLGRVNPLALVVWGSLVVPVPMAIASLCLEGPTAIVASMTHVGMRALLSLAYVVYFSTLVGYSLWAWLLVRHPASVVTPFALLVPVVSMLSSAWLLHEPLPAWKVEATALVIAGLGLNVFGPRLLPTLTKSVPTAPKLANQRS